MTWWQIVLAVISTPTAVALLVAAACWIRDQIPARRPF